jgi:hypothetical protein
MILRKLVPACWLAMLGLSALPAAAQVNPLSTTAGLKAACESSAGNVVVISSDIAVNIGFPANSPQQVSTGCRIELTAGADIQFDKVGLAFAGPLVITGGAQSGLQMQEASLAAPNVLVQFTNVEGAIKMEYSRIDAAAGNLDVRFGPTSNLEVIGSRTAGAPLSRAAFVATGNVSIAPTRLHTAMYKDTGIVAGGTISVTAPGSDISIGFENSGAYAYNGDIRLDLAFNRNKVEISNASLTAVTGQVSLVARGVESLISASNAAVQAGTSVHVTSMASKGEVKVSNGSIVAGGSILLEGVTASFDGTLLVENVQISGGGDIRLLTGFRGKTMVFGNRINGAGLVQAATKTWGVCEANNNQVTAPLAQLCL